MGDKPNPWEPIVELFRMGCAPLGYRRDPQTNLVEFVVYAPEVQS